MDLHSIYKKFPAEFPLPMVLDGATGTSLMKKGMPSGACTEKWVGENPDTLIGIQRGYREAGSDAVLTPTFGCSRPALERNGIGDDVYGRTLRLAKLSRCAGPGLIGGDMSPSGLFLEPYGDTDFETMVKIFAEQAKAIADSGADFIFTETNISLAETRAAVIGAKEATGLPVFASLTLTEIGRTLSGDTAEASLLTLADAGVSAFGFNCSFGPGEMLEIMKPIVPLAAALGVPLIAKPNAGLPHDGPDGTRFFDLGADEFAGYMPMFLKAGIPILGGCCGTDAEYIRKIREAADTFEPSAPPAFAGNPSKLVCDNKTVVEADTEGKNPLECGEELFESGDDFLFVRLNSEDDAAFLLENMFMLPAPLVLCGDRASAEAVKRRYCGKLLILD